MKSDQDISRKVKSHYPVKLHDFDFVEAELISYDKVISTYPNHQLLDMEVYHFC